MVCEDIYQLIVCPLQRDPSVKHTLFWSYFVLYTEVILYSTPYSGPTLSSIQRLYYIAHLILVLLCPLYRGHTI